MTLTYNTNLLWYVGGYFVLMIVLGIFFSQKIKNSEDYILAGRSLGPVVLVGTLLATWCGSGTVSGGGNSLAYAFGFWPGLLYVVPSLVGIAVLYYIAPKIRELGKYTLAEILEVKYGAGARGLAALIIILAFVGITSYQFKGIGFLLNVTTGISVEWGTILGAVLIIFLAFSGGLKSVAATDAISAFLMLAGLIIAAPMAVAAAGGWDAVVAKLPPGHMTLTGSLTPLQMLGYYLPLLFLLMGDQNMAQRLTAAKTDKTMRIGLLGWFIGLIVVFPLVAVLAVVSRAMYAKIPAGMALMSTTTILPEFVGGILLASATAFIVTTGDSYLLSAATSLTYDIYGKFIKPHASDKEKFTVIKIAIIVLGVLSYALIMYFPTVLAAQMYSYTVYAAGVTPAFLGVFLWKRVTKAAGLASMAAGIVSTLYLEFAKPFAFTSSLISIPVAILALIVVTLLTSSQGNSKIDKDFQP